jgi:hypothetical protein
MMGSCAFLMPLASATFVRRGRYAPGAAARGERTAAAAATPPSPLS